MESSVTLSREDYDEWVKERDFLKLRLSQLENEKQPKMYIECEIGNIWYRRQQGYKWHTVLLLPTVQLDEIREEIKTTIIETVKDFFEKQDEVKAIRKLPKWFLKLLI